MDRRERGSSPQAGQLAILAGLQASIWTALPGIIESFDPVKKTTAIQPTIQAQVQQPDGSQLWVTLPLLVDCPVVFPSGGGFTLTFPINPGDEALVVFASRCIDSWWQSGGVQVQAELRMHDLSDGFAFVGISSLPSVPAAISAEEVQLRDSAGTTSVALAPGGHVRVTAAASIDMVAPTINMTGDVFINGVEFNTHFHPGVRAGADNTEGPQS